MPAERRVECKGKVKSEEAGWWQQPPFILRERLHVGDHVDLHRLEKHDKMDKMVKVMVPMSTGQSNRTSAETYPKAACAGPG